MEPQNSRGKLPPSIFRNNYDHLQSEYRQWWTQPTATRWQQPSGNYVCVVRCPGQSLETQCPPPMPMSTIRPSISVTDSLSSPPLKRPRLVVNKTQVVVPVSKGLQKHVSDLEEKLAQSQNECLEMRQKQTEAEKRENQLRVQVTEYKSKGKIHEMEMEREYKSKIEENIIEILRKNNANLQERLDNAELSERNLKARLSVHHAQNAECEKKLAVKTEELNTTRTTTEKLQCEVEKTVDRADGLKDQIQTLVASVEPRLQFLDGLQEQVETLQTENVKLKTEMHYSKVRTKDLESILEESERNLNEVEIQFLNCLKEKDEKLAATMNKLATVQEQLNKIQAVSDSESMIGSVNGELVCH